MKLATPSSRQLPLDQERPWWDVALRPELRPVPFIGHHGLTVSGKEIWVTRRQQPDRIGGLVASKKGASRLSQRLASRASDSDVYQFVLEGLPGSSCLFTFDPGPGREVGATRRGKGVQVSTCQFQATGLDIDIRRFGRPNMDAASVPTNPDGPSGRSLPGPADRSSSDGLEAGTVRAIKKVSHALSVLFDRSTLVGVPWKPSQSEHSEVALRDDVDRPPWTPYLDQVRVIPCIEVNILHPCVKRKKSRPRNAVLKTHIRCLIDVFPGESSIEMIRPQSVAENLTPGHSLRLHSANRRATSAGRLLKRPQERPKPTQMKNGNGAKTP